MRVLGIDPGSTRTGYGCVEAEGSRFICVEAGTLSAPAAKDIYDRLAELGIELEGVIAEMSPDAVAIERGFVKMIRGKLQQGALVSSAARGVAGYVAARAGLRVFEYAPATVKKSVTGHGNAKKPEVARMVQYLLCLRNTPAPDAADALAVAITHALTQPTQGQIERATAGSA